jgi:hypothetical protein
MKKIINSVVILLFSILFNTASPAQSPANPPANFKHQTALINGINIHYAIGGKGEPLVLIHGAKLVHVESSFTRTFEAFYCKLTRP